MRRLRSKCKSSAHPSSPALSMCAAVAVLGLGMAVPAASVAASAAAPTASGQVSLTPTPGAASGGGSAVAPAAIVTRTGTCTNVPGTPCRVDYNSGRGTTNAIFFFSDATSGSKAYTCTANKCQLTATGWPSALRTAITWELTGPNIRVIRVY